MQRKIRTPEKSSQFGKKTERKPLAFLGRMTRPGAVSPAENTPFFQYSTKEEKSHGSPGKCP
jgi:hypothetical protein